MPRKKLTAASVEALAAPANGQVDYFDQVLPGFVLRASAKGRKSWVVFYRVQAGPDKGKLRRHTLGAYPMLSLAEARDKARHEMQAVANGGDPAREKREQRKAAPPKASTFADVVESYIRLYAKRQTKTWAETERIFAKNVLPHWGHRPIESITRRDVIELLDGIMEEGADYKANRTLAAVRKLFNWVLQRDMIEASPVAQVEAPGKETKRDRVLSDDEIKDIWTGCDKLGWSFGPFVKLLLVTGQRRDEVAGMRWRDLDLDEATWTIPREMTKSDREHAVPLSPLAKDIIGTLPRLGTYVFTTRRDRPISGYSVGKKRIDAAAGVTGWRLHDLRRTAASGMAKLNVAPHVLSRVLNHASASLQGVTAIYNRYGYEAEKRHALETWAHHIDGLIEPQPENVVTLDARS
jgi:integrase